MNPIVIKFISSTVGVICGILAGWIFAILAVNPNDPNAGENGWVMLLIGLMMGSAAFKNCSNYLTKRFGNTKS